MSGGGVKGVAYIGLFRVLDEIRANLYANSETQIDIKEMCCVSIGSFIGLLYVVGYTYEELYKEVMDVDFSSLKDFRIKHLVNKYGMDNGRGITGWLWSLLEKRGVSKDITFRELYRKFGVNFRVCVTNVNKYCMEIFDYTTNPNLKVVKAVRMSTSIPFVFCAERYNNNIYVDGAVVNNFPIRLYSDKLDTTLGCKIIGGNELDEDRYYEIDSFDSYMVHLIGCFMSNRERDTTMINDYIDHTICIPAHRITQSVNYELTEQDKRNLIEMGYTCTLEYFDLV